MGVNIDLHIYELPKLLTELEKIGASGELLSKILESCGTIIGDKYVLLNNEFWEDGSPYYIVTNLIDSAFNVEDSFDVFCRKSDLTGETEGINYVELQDVADELGIILKEENEEEE